VLQVGEYDLSFKNRILYENKDVKASLAFSLYKDGLREIRFMKGIEEWEVQGVIDILKHSETINSLEDDVVTFDVGKRFHAHQLFGHRRILRGHTGRYPRQRRPFRKNLVSNPLAHQVEWTLAEEGAEERIDLDEILSKAMEEPLPLFRSKCLFPQSRRSGRIEKEVESEIIRLYIQYHRHPL